MLLGFTSVKGPILVQSAPLFSELDRLCRLPLSAGSAPGHSSSSGPNHTESRGMLFAKDAKSPGMTDLINCVFLQAYMLKKKEENIFFPPRSSICL